MSHIQYATSNLKPIKLHFPRFEFFYINILNLNVIEPKMVLCILKRVEYIGSYIMDIFKVKHLN